MHYMKSHGMHRGSKVFCLASLRPPQARPKFRIKFYILCKFLHAECNDVIN